jgi:hypothetical protein
MATSKCAKYRSVRPPVVLAEEEEADGAEATETGNDSSSLLFALRNAFISLNDEEFECEVDIERRRHSIPFIKALRNVFLHLQVSQFETEIAMERQRRAKYHPKNNSNSNNTRNSSNNNSKQASNVEPLADIHGKLFGNAAKPKVTIEKDEATKSISRAAVATSPASRSLAYNDDRRVEMMMGTTTTTARSRQNFSYTEPPRFPLLKIEASEETTTGQELLGRWHDDRDHENSNEINISPTSTNTSNNCDALAHTKINPRKKTHVTDATDVVGRESTTTTTTAFIHNKKRRQASSSSGDDTTESEDEETETETEDADEVEEEARDDEYSWNNNVDTSRNTTISRLGNKKDATRTSKVHVGTHCAPPLPITTDATTAFTPRYKKVSQSANEKSTRRWTADDDIGLTKIMKKYYKSPNTCNWETVAKELKSRT